MFKKNVNLITFVIALGFGYINGGAAGAPSGERSVEVQNRKSPKQSKKVSAPAARKKGKEAAPAVVVAPVVPDAVALDEQNALIGEGGKGAAESPEAAAADVVAAPAKKMRKQGKISQKKDKNGGERSTKVQGKA